MTAIVTIIFDVVALVAEEFLSTSASQLTYHGLCELSATLKDEQLCVLFRNNHFSTLYKHKVHLSVSVGFSVNNKFDDVRRIISDLW